MSVDRTITAEAVITAKDGTGDTFTKIAAKFQQLGKGARVSAEIEKMAQSLKVAESQLRALDKLQSTRAGFADARTKFRAQQAAVEQAARAMRNAEKPTRELEAAYERAQVAVSRASAAFQRQKTALLDAQHAAEGFGAPLARIAGEQTRLKAAIESTTRAIEHQGHAELKTAEAGIQAAAAQKRAAKEAAHREHAIAHHGITSYVVGGVAAGVSAHGIARGAEKGLEAGAERQHVVTGMLNAGMPMAEVERAQKLATEVSKGAPNLSVSQIMELHKEARSAVQHPEEVFEIMPDLAKAASVLRGMGAQNANIADLVKGAESLGLMNDPKRFHHYLEGQVKSMQVMGKTITTEQVYEAAKYSKAAGATLSDDFINLTMPSLIQEMHGSSAGDALSMMAKTLRGGLQHKHLPVERLNELGMLEDSSLIRRSKTGEILGYKGKIVGDSLMASDPDKFAHLFNEHMEAHGIKSLEDKVKTLYETLPSTAANLMRILIQQEETLRQHRANYNAAPGLDQAAANQAKDPTVALQALKASLDDLAAAATSPMMVKAAGGLNVLSGSLKSLAAAAENHPVVAATAATAATGAAAAGAGYMSYQLMNGFGLGASATALDHSAAALEAAAVRLGAAGAAGAAEGAAGLGGLAKPGMKAAGLLGMGTIGSAGLLMGGLLAFDAAMIYGAPAVFGNKKGARYGGKQGEPDEDPDHPGMHFVQSSRRGSNGYWEKNPVAPTFTGGTHGYPAEPHPALAPIAEGGGARPIFAGGAFGSAPMPPIDVTGKVDAEVKGQATVSVTVKVDGPGQVTNQVSSSSGNIKVSTGSSMPGAKSPTSGAANGGK